MKDDWDWGAKADAHEFTSDDYGKFEVKGLAYGSYTLIETQAPTGYNLRSDVNFDVDKIVMLQQQQQSQTPYTNASLKPAAWVQSYSQL